MTKDEIHKKMMLDSIVIFIFNILALAAGYFTRSLLSKSIPLQDFGLFYAMLTFFTFITLFIDLGFSEAMVKFLPQKKDKRDEIISIYLAVRFVTSALFIALLIIFKPWLVHEYFKSPLAAQGLDIFMLMLVFGNISSLLQTYFQAKKKMFLTGFYYFLQRLLFLLAIIAFIWLGFDKDFFIPSYAYLLSVFIVFAFGVYYFIKMRPLLSFDSALFRAMFRFALLSSMAGATSMLLGYIDTIMLTKIYEPSIVGVYSSVIATVLLLSYFANSVATVLLPNLSELYVNPSKKEYLKKLLDFVIMQISILLLPMIVIVFVFTREILLFFYTSEFLIGISTTQVLLIGMLPMSVVMIYNSFFAAANKPELILKATFVGALLNVVMNLYLIPRHMIFGAGLATTLSYVIMFAMTHVYIKRLFGIRFTTSKLFLLFLIGLASTAILLAIKGMPFFGNVIYDCIAKTVIFLVAYGLLALLSGLVNLDDYKRILKK